MISSPNTDLLVDELESLCQEEGVDSPFEHALATAMQTLEVDTVTRLSSWGHCCLLAVPVLAADVSRLKQQLMTAAAPGTLPDNAVLRTIVGGIARSVPKLVAAYDKSKEPPAALSPATVVKGPAVSADKLEREECATCYDDLRRLQNRTVDLPERATCVSAGRHSVVQYGYIAELPSVKAVKTYGTAGALKRRVALAGMEAGAGAHITFDEKLPDIVNSIPAAQRQLRTLMNAMAAIMTVKISTTAYGGRDVGWVTVPGEATQVRLMVTINAIDKMMWALLSIATTDSGKFCDTVDNFVLEFLTVLARCSQHPDEIITNLTESKPHLLIPRGGEGSVSSGGSSGGSSSQKTLLEPHGSLGAGSNVGICSTWVLEGGCMAAGCQFLHPSQARGRAGGGRDGGNNGGANRNRNGGGNNNNGGNHNNGGSANCRGRDRGGGRNGGRGNHNNGNNNNNNNNNNGNNGGGGAKGGGGNGGNGGNSSGNAKGQ